MQITIVGFNKVEAFCFAGVSVVGRISLFALLCGFSGTTDGRTLIMVPGCAPALAASAE